MEYKLFDDYITLQALLKELGIIQSGGAIKGYLAETTVLFNGQDEKRRGKKIRIGDTITIPEENVEIRIVEPTSAEKQEHLEAIAEKNVSLLLSKSSIRKIKKLKNKIKEKQNKQMNVNPFVFQELKHVDSKNNVKKLS